MDKFKKVVELARKGFSDKEIAKILNLKVRTVIEYRCMGGIKKRKYNKRLSEEKVKLIKILNEHGFNDKEIASILGISVSTVYKYRKIMGLKAVGKTCCSVLNTYISRGWYKDLEKINEEYEEKGLGYIKEKYGHGKLRTLHKFRMAKKCGEETLKILEVLLGESKQDN